MSALIGELALRLFDRYEDFKETSLFNRRFKQSDILPLIAQRQESAVLTVSQVGLSFEGRAIQQLSGGKGKQKALFWSQMHGDEATATMALFDIFNFLEAENDGFDAFRQLILSNITLYFVPMLNPDGAERFQRPTAQMIDMNRDALALQTPEANLLKGLIDGLKPDFGFNLHDQNPRYTAGITSHLATLSFLATSYDYQLSVNDTRLRSMQLITAMNEVLQRFIPNQVGRFNDDHEPRAFGDNIQKWGTTLVLVESGGYRGDPEKQFIRKLNFVALLTALGAIATGSYKQNQQKDYEAIPLNSRSAYDLILRGVNVEMGGKGFKLDVGINREEENNEKSEGFFYQSKTEEIGDLRTYFGLEELDASDLVLTQGKVYPERIVTEEQLAAKDFFQLLNEGYVFFKLDERLKQTLMEKGRISYPIHVIDESVPSFEGVPKVGEPATFLLKKNQKVRYAIVNGFVHHLAKSVNSEANGIIG